MKKLGLLVVLVAVAVMFAVPAFAQCGKCSTCAKPCAAPCPKPCVTCDRPCNPIQSTADQITCMQRPCQKCTFVNPICRIGETLCPGPGKEKNMLKCWYCCDAKPCPKPCATCVSSCSRCGKVHEAAAAAPVAAPVAAATK